MLIEIRAPDRLKGDHPVEVGAVLRSVLQHARESPIDLARLRVVCDWIQYRANFREPVSVRHILTPAVQVARNERRATEQADVYELAIDLRRSKAESLDASIAEALLDPERPRTGRQYLEEWQNGSQSCIWSFNALYWKALGLWEQVTGQEYERSLPGGESDARNTASARTLIEALFTVWDGLTSRRALPEELHVLELGVGNGNQARVFLDEFVRLDRARGTDYYRRLHYLMGDYSPHVLDLARTNVRDHAEHVSGLVLDATRPTQTLGFLRYKAFLVYISNVYDNLPTDEIVRLGGHLYLVQVRAYVPGPAAEAISSELGIAPAELPDLAHRLLRLGPELLSEAAPERFTDAPAAVGFWARLWGSLCLEERYVPLEALDFYEVAPGLSGEMLRSIVEANGDLRMPVSNGAAASFVDTLPLLHPYGLLQCHDLFTTEVEQFTTGFRGPGKYDGSVVNWVNGSVLTAIGARRGFEVAIEPFAHRSGANVSTLTTRVRD